MKISHRKEEDVPAAPFRPGTKVSRSVEEIMAELTRIPEGMVMVIETEDEKAIRATKALITRAGKELGMHVAHWHAGTEVYAKPTRASRMHMERSERANRGDNRKSGRTRS